MNPPKQYHFYVKQDARCFLPASLQPMADKVNLFQHRIICGNIMWRINDSEQTLLKRAYMEDELGYRDAAALLDFVKSNQPVFTIDKTYIPGKRSRAYGFASGYMLRPTRRLKCENAALNRRLAERDRRNYNCYTKAHRHLVQWLPQFNIDQGKAIPMVENSEWPNENLQTVQMLVNGDFNHSRCDYGRFHSTYTRLMGDIRSCIMYQGSYLAVIDVSNSQPLFLAIAMLQSGDYSAAGIHAAPDSASCESLPHMALLPSGLVGSPSSDFHTSGAGVLASDVASPASTGLPSLPITGTHPCPIRSSSGVKNIHNPLQAKEDTSRFNLQENAADAMKQKVLNPTIMKQPISSQTQVHDGHLPEDLKRYIKLVTSGQLYQYVIQQIGWTTGKADFKANEWFLFLYGRPGVPTLTRELFKREFPTVWQYIQQAKGGRRSKGDDYKRLAWEMQRAESRLMIDQCVSRLRDERPEIPIITIHDSFMTLPKFIPVVRQIILEEFGKLGIAPSFGYEDYTEDQEIILEAA